jgi:hypothetical protein
MFVRWPRALALGLAAAVCLACDGRTLACTVARGDRVQLSSQALDPDVFVWDSAQRLINYIEGDYNVETVLQHTVLVGPGTRAVAVSCRDAAARPKYSKTDLDIIGVKLTSGRNKGHYGWVAAEDVRRADGKPIIVTTPVFP